ncbi:MAG: HDOD domain-containing protein [Desulfurivibrionaceae bacterium]
MRRIRGDLGLMELTELMQWAEMGQKNGTLTIASQEIYKYFFFQHGELIYFTSKKQGEQLGEFLLAGNYLNRLQLSRTLKESRRLGIPLIAHLIAQNFLDEDQAVQALKDLVQSSIIDILKWEEGIFEFSEKIPEAILNGPIKLNATNLVMLAAVQYDHEAAEAESQKSGEILEDFRNRLADGRISLPPAPDLFQKLNMVSDDENAAFWDIGKIIMSDQVLTSKIFKVANSSFYNPVNKTASLQRAIDRIGVSSVKSIAMALALENFSLSHQERIRPILEHSLFSGFIARTFTLHLQLSTEESFLCAILHDIGKIVLFSLLEEYNLFEEEREKIIHELHAEVGYQIAISWDLAEVVQETARFHHTPEQAGRFPDQVSLINLADRVAQSSRTRSFLDEVCKILLLDENEGEHLLYYVDSLKPSSEDLI